MTRASWLAILAGLVLGAASGAAAAPSGLRTLTVYSVATGVQFINTADDRARGKANNPLGSAANKLSPTATTTGGGPFPGDVAVYNVDLYAGKTLKQRAGSATYTCYFNYAKNALCEAYYQLPGASTLVASGPIDFTKTGFTIVVTGGTKKYLGARGDVRVAGAARDSQRIEFELLP